MFVSEAERNKQRYLIFIDVSTHFYKDNSGNKIIQSKRIAFDLFRAHDEELNKFYLVSCLLSSNFIVYNFCSRLLFSFTTLRLWILKCFSFCYHYGGCIMESAIANQ